MRKDVVAYPIGDFIPPPTLSKEQQEDLQRAREEWQRRHAFSERRRVSRDTHGQGYVYALYGEGYTKIGHSSDVYARMKGLLSPFPLSIVAKIPVRDMACSELLLHILFARKRVHGEWFRLCGCGCDVAFILSRQWLWPRYHERGKHKLLEAFQVFIDSKGREGIAVRPPENHVHLENTARLDAYFVQLEPIALRSDLTLWDTTFLRNILKKPSRHLTSKQHAQVKRIVAQYSMESAAAECEEPLQKTIGKA